MMLTNVFTNLANLFNGRFKNGISGVKGSTLQDVKLFKISGDTSPDSHIAGYRISLAV